MVMPYWQKPWQKALSLRGNESTSQRLNGLLTGRDGDTATIPARWPLRQRLGTTAKLVFAFLFDSSQLLAAQTEKCGYSCQPQSQISSPVLAATIHHTNHDRCLRHAQAIMGAVVGADAIPLDHARAA